MQNGVTRPANHLKIIHISTETGWRGGEQQLTLLTDGLAARGHRSIVLTPPESKLFEDRLRAGIARPLSYISEFDVFAARRLTKLARTENADILHAHTSHAHSLAYIASRWTHVPVVVTRRVDFPVNRNWLSSKKYGSKSVHFVAISEAIRQVLLSAGIPDDHVSLVYSGVDPSRFEYRDRPRDDTAAAQFGAPAGVPVLVNVAALTDHKDQATLLHAAALLRDHGTAFKLIIAGSGELESHLKSLATELALNSHVQFIGYVQNLVPLYHAADVFVLSSHMEGLCTSILDAMLAGVPVVATRTGGVPEIVENERNGLLVAPRNPAALAEGLEKLMSDPKLRMTFAAQGRSTVLGRFTADCMVDGNIAVYKQVLANAGTRSDV